MSTDTEPYASIRPGKPGTRLTPLEFARRVGLSRDSVYRYVGSDALPERFVAFTGKRKILIEADAVEWFLATSRRLRGG
jgi:hypothetical protein